MSNSCLSVDQKNKLTEVEDPDNKADIRDKHDLQTHMQSSNSLQVTVNPQATLAQGRRSRMSVFPVSLDNAKKRASMVQ